MKSLAALTLLVLASASAHTEASEVLVFGPGHWSCAKWLGNSVNEAQGITWIQGFWTGSNHKSWNGSVGHTNDIYGIVGETKKLCNEHPSYSLYRSSAEVFSNFDKGGK